MADASKQVILPNGLEKTLKFHCSLWAVNFFELPELADELISPKEASCGTGARVVTAVCFGEKECFAVYQESYKYLEMLVSLSKSLPGSPNEARECVLTVITFHLQHLYLHN